MGFLKHLLDIFVHLDKHLDGVIQNYGLWSYFLLFGIVFSETGLVIAPLLPGDSLLFAAGTLAARSSLHFSWLFLLLCLAAILGDTVNYWIGSILGPKVFHEENMRFLNKKHFEKTHRFYEKYGGKTIILARFVPIVRTFAPFVAGIGKMTYWKFISYNVFGGIAWVLVGVSAGYFFGNIPAVKNNFSLVLLAIIFLSILPGIIEYLRHRSQPAHGTGI